MAPYIQMPQTPSAKTHFDERVNELAFASDRTASYSTLDRATDAEEIARYRQKTVSPNPSQQETRDSHLGLLQQDDAFHRLSIGSFSDAGYGLSVSSAAYHTYPTSHGPASSPGSIAPRPMWARIWARHKAVLLVFGAQFFGALMNLFARLLELDSEGQNFHPVQLLFVRMLVTTGASCWYMHYYRIPHFPFGPPGVRWLLVLRGLTGFFGIFGMWYSMMYLPLAEATVFTFLTPSVSGYICSILLKDPFTRKEQIASVVAFFGIILITRPLSLFSSSSSAAPSESFESSDGFDAGSLNATVVAFRDMVNATLDADLDTPSVASSSIADADSGNISTGQRLLAIAVALFGVLGGSFAFTTIRAIGTRAHTLVSVNYFSTCCIIVTFCVLTFAPILDIGQPALQFALPHSLRQWVLLMLICICGFGTQILATKGLGLERSNRATAMVYTQMLFAAGFDRFVFGHEMGPTSLVGCGLIIGSALWAALSKKPAPENKAVGAPAIATELGVLSEPSGAAAATAADAPFVSSAADLEVGLVGSRERHPEAVPMLAAEDGSDEEIEDFRSH
ncbi:hypothetical protein HMPREF1624_03516 [Sporothrix schenckii ATCC 58251]|uniref:EamA domain-containing protein n=1 Tax=Sporothrix schenckii (strain ATCC 58251 / de Perez 2211183) TaxID=1391915 RepID=U7PYX9_SPOS1|nr:hypothetical protein HMPREF1624_03516 [Sporothrix schenckii ATCC 58251]